jgi:predicted metal-dependent phosphoesterase TrpH
VIDLHTHSNMSDGTDSPSELIRKAEAAGISLLALTDHDTISGWQAACAALTSGMDLVLGAEISCISIHMLGLLFDPENEALLTELAKTRENRLTRMDRIIEKLNAAGIEISIEDVMAQLSDGATLGRPHLADALIAKGHVDSREAAFTALLHNGSKYYVSHYSPTPEAAIRLIKAAGGVAVIAHPYASQRGKIITAESFTSLVEAGLDGIEVDHRDHNESEKASLLRVAYSYDLAITGASDYHGSGKINQLAENTTALMQWEKLESRANNRRVVRK